MQAVEFVTCDLLDDHEDKNIQVVMPFIDGKFFKHYGAVSRFYGEVVTVKCFEDNSRVKELLATDGTGKVLVVDGGGSMRCALMGDMIAASAAKNHWNGVVIYGCVRDVDELEQINIGIQALGSNPQKSIRKDVGEINLAVHFGGVTFNSGDYIYVDRNGILRSEHDLLSTTNESVHAEKS